MKLSVIIGVTHMILGIFMKALNSLHKKSKIDFICEFVPQLIFMTLLFGYMDFLIIFKWLKPWDDGINPEQWAPSIITTMINLGLTMGKTVHIVINRALNQMGGATCGEKEGIRLRIPSS